MAAVKVVVESSGGGVEPDADVEPDDDVGVSIAEETVVVESEAVSEAISEAVVDVAVTVVVSEE